MANEGVPDFTWPYRVAQRLSSWLSAEWQGLVKFGAGAVKGRFLRSVVQVAVWSCAAYAGLVWVCICYIYFPVPHYGFWDLAKWIGIVGAVTSGAISMLYGGSAVAAVLWLFLSITVCFALSLFYLCWVVLAASRNRSQWLNGYRSVLLAGFLSSLALATFIDGSYRFWDRPFEIGPWIKLVLICTSGWATLFCHLVRERALQPGTRRAVVKWTVGLTMALGLLALWAASGNKAEYFLRKKVVEHPKDVSAWLDLAWHYKDQGESLEADSGNDDQGPPDPAPSYRDSLECLNQAVSLGAGGFKIQLARAQLADALEDKQDAMSFGRKALDLALSSSDTPPSEREYGVKWLREMIARNASAASADDVKQRIKRQVQIRRRDGLPGVLRWIFQLL